MASVVGTLFGRRARITIALPKGSFSDTDPTQNTVEIVGGDEPGNTGLRVTFKATKTNQKEPNTLEVVIYNLAQTTRGRLQTKGLRVTVEAGYVATGLSLIFVGDSRTTDHIRAGANWLTTIKCGDGERSNRFARASESFAAGTTVGAVVNYCAQSMGLALGNSGTQAAKLAKALQHGWTVHGAASTELERILRAVGYTYSIQDGQIQILAPGESVAQSIPDIDVTSGLLGSPEMGSPEKAGKPQLLKFKSLLLPQARAGGRVHVKSERYDGVFLVRKLVHSGDTRGGDWETSYEAVNDATVKVA